MLGEKEAVGRLESPVKTSWRQSSSVWDPANPPPCTLPVRRDTRYQGGSRGPVISSHLSASTTVPFIRPVWWILFSALLSWVIWGIIPKVSKLLAGVLRGRFCFRRDSFWGSMCSKLLFLMNRQLCSIFFPVYFLGAFFRNNNSATKSLPLLHNIKTCPVCKMHCKTESYRLDYILLKYFSFIVCLLCCIFSLW